MPRQPRQLSKSGYLHIIIRGIGKQLLFEERQDYIFFLAVLKRFCTETKISVLAYCLMENHVHLLVYSKQKSPSLLMKKLCVSYSNYFNRKYERSGHLFQDRYRSENIESDRYLLAVFRYILNNPQKAGICSAFEYEWSSIKKYGDDKSFVDTKTFSKIIGDKKQYEAFITADNEDSCMEFEDTKHNDEWAKAIISKILQIKSGTVLQSLNSCDRDNALRRLKAEGLTLRQLERLTGISRGIITRAQQCPT